MSVAGGVDMLPPPSSLLLSGGETTYSSSEHFRGDEMESILGLVLADVMSLLRQRRVMLARLSQDYSPPNGLHFRSVVQGVRHKGLQLLLFAGIK